MVFLLDLIASAVLWQSEIKANHSEPNKTWIIFSPRESYTFLRHVFFPPFPLTVLSNYKEMAINRTNTQLLKRILFKLSTRLDAH